MNYDDEENSSEMSSASEISDSDLATVLIQLIRSGRAHILSERTLQPALQERNETFNDFVAALQPPPADMKPDTANLQNSDIHLSTTLSSGLFNNTRKPRSQQIPALVYQRQIGMNGIGQFTQGDRSFIGHSYLPNKYIQVVNYANKMFCGTYSTDGNVFLSAGQDRVIRVFDTSRGKFKLLRWIQGRDVGWSILDTAFSPDGQSIIYSSWSESIHLCNVYGDGEKHEVLPLYPELRRFCVFSVMFSQDGQEILGGANDGCLYVYDCEKHQRTLRIQAHLDDVNAVTFADETSHILFSGGDDGLCKVWDRRTLDESSNRLPVGTFAGHVDGLTYIDSRRDGRHLITNSKDQCIKLWDMRKFSSLEAQEQTRQFVRTQNWDYRWQNAPWRLACSSNSVPGDTSLMTYRGHSVLQTLIRCRFSPSFTTGQRYIYTGCAAGRVIIYDVLSGTIEGVLPGHTACVRDVSWHPYLMELVDTAWDGRHFKWFYSSPNAEELQLDSSYADSNSEDDSDSDNSDDQEINWVRDSHRSSYSHGLLRRSPRLAARQEQRQPPLRRSSRRHGP